MPLKCPKCGNYLNDDETVCPNCGEDEGFEDEEYCGLNSDESVFADYDDDIYSCEYEDLKELNEDLDDFDEDGLDDDKHKSYDSLKKATSSDDAVQDSKKD